MSLPATGFFFPVPGEPYISRIRKWYAMDFLSLDFINSRWNATHPPMLDGLLDEAWQADFTTRWDLSLPAPWPPDAVEQLKDLRDVLVAIIERLEQGQSASAGQVARLNTCLVRAPLLLELRAEGGAYHRLTSVQAAGLDRALFAIADSFAALLAEGEPRRIRLCGNPACRWAFYDESKNHSRNWCGNTCSSLIKVRNFRERKKMGENL
jgi:predicted RNA-binding Zn ribbon-like protein